MNTAITPGATIGVLGSGQLGRMLAMAARRLGYRIHTFSPDRDTPAGQVADLEIQAAYDDLDALRDFAAKTDVVTFEFENVPAATVAAAADRSVVRPNGRALAIAQHRAREKRFLEEQGIPVAAWAPVNSDEDLTVAVARIGRASVLKTAALGYDGKGQVRVDDQADPVAAWNALGRREAILEQFVDLDREISVIGARALDGAWAFFGPIENVHRHHILDVSTAPADVPAAIRTDALRITRAVMDGLDYVGVLCVEFFVARDGRLLVNELAPRPHNSGHLTIDACRTSQFEQHVRAICGLPLGAADMLQPAAMANLLGDLWRAGEPNWARALAVPGVVLHLYGKTSPRPGRKMGHVTALASSPDEARALVLDARRALHS